MVSIGIIYKFTILAEYEFCGHGNPYYVGQHWGESVNFYNGSGKIWNDFLGKLKREFPKNKWRKYIKKEILFRGKCNQKTLDKLEEIYIRREKSHYSYNLGGCNVAWGGSSSRIDESVKKILSEKNLGKKLSEETKRRMSESRKGMELSEEHKKKLADSKRGENNPMKREEVRKKISKANKGKKSWNKGKSGCFTKETIEKMRDAKIGTVPWNKGKKMSEEQKKKLSDALRGRKLSEEHKENIKKYVSQHPPFKGKHHSEETKEKLRKAALKQFNV